MFKTYEIGVTIFLILNLKDVSNPQPVYILQFSGTKHLQEKQLHS